VLGMVDVELIKQMKRNGRSIREISRMTGWSRQTVRRHLDAPAEPPIYTAAGPRPLPVMGPYLDVISRWLEDDESAPRKQRTGRQEVLLVYVV
jgi:transposase